MLNYLTIQTSIWDEEWHICLDYEFNHQKINKFKSTSCILTGSGHKWMYVLIFKNLSKKSVGNTYIEWFECILYSTKIANFKIKKPCFQKHFNVELVAFLYLHTYPNEVQY